jgi:hypothetical protein
MRFGRSKHRHNLGNSSARLLDIIGITVRFRRDPVADHLKLKPVLPQSNSFSALICDNIRVWGRWSTDDSAWQFRT